MTWWRHQIETFSALLALCAGNSPTTGGFLSPRPVRRSLDVFFGLRLNIGLRKQSRRRWFERPSHPLLRHCNGWINANRSITDKADEIQGCWFNIKMSSYQYRYFHCGDKTIWRPSYPHNRISYTGKITSLYWIRPQTPPLSSCDAMTSTDHRWFPSKSQSCGALVSSFILACTSCWLNNLVVGDSLLVLLTYHVKLL